MDNHLGTCAVEVEADGAVVSYEEYHPYGTSAYRSQRGTLDVSAKRYRYTGKERDEETGLYYHGARYYAPWLGRWTAADPLAFADGTGPYGYVSNRPVIMPDPDGRDPAISIGGWEAGISLLPPLSFDYAPTWPGRDTLMRQQLRQETTADQLLDEALGAHIEETVELFVELRPLIAKAAKVDDQAKLRALGKDYKLGLRLFAVPLWDTTM